MKHLWKGASALALFGVVVATLSAGCVEAEAPFFIVSALSPSCDDVSVDSTIITRGLMDVRYNCLYYGTLLLANEHIRRGDDAKLQIETSHISVTGVDVQILRTDEAAVSRSDGSAAEFFYPTTGFVEAARSTTPGRGIAEVMLVDGATAQALGEAFFDTDPTNDVTTVMARVVAHGRTLGGNDVHTRPWDFPIDICYGCLCECGGDTTAGEECSLGQDNIPVQCESLPGFTCQINSPCLRND